jgi:hypothetical protein
MISARTFGEAGMYLTLILHTLSVGSVLVLTCLLGFNNQYTRNFYRATWVLTALDAGFLTAMKVRPAFLKDFLSLAFSIFYLFFSESADEKVRIFAQTLFIYYLVGDN